MARKIRILPMKSPNLASSAWHDGSAKIRKEKLEHDGSFAATMDETAAVMADLAQEVENDILSSLFTPASTENATVIPAPRKPRKVEVEYDALPPREFRRSIYAPDPDDVQRIIEIRARIHRDSHAPTDERNRTPMPADLPAHWIQWGIDILNGRDAGDTEKAYRTERGQYYLFDPPHRIRLFLNPETGILTLKPPAEQRPSNRPTHAWADSIRYTTMYPPVHDPNATFLFPGTNL